MVKYQESATPAKDKAFQPNSRVVTLHPPSYLGCQICLQHLQIVIKTIRWC